MKTLPVNPLRLPFPQNKRNSSSLTCFLLFSLSYKHKIHTDTHTHTVIIRSGFIMYDVHHHNLRHLFFLSSRTAILLHPFFLPQKILLDSKSYMYCTPFSPSPSSPPCYLSHGTLQHPSLVSYSISDPIPMAPLPSSRLTCFPTQFSSLYYPVSSSIVSTNSLVQTPTFSVLFSESDRYMWGRSDPS